MDMGGCEHAAHTQCCAHPCAWGTHEQTLSSPSLLSPSVPRHQGEELAGGSMEVRRLREVCLSWYSEQSIYMVTATDLQLSTSWLAESINRCTQSFPGRLFLQGSRECCRVEHSHMPQGVRGPQGCAAIMSLYISC